MITTLNKIREHSPCASGLKKLLRSLNKTEADDEPVSIVQILDSNGLNYALLCLRAVEGRDREIRHYVVGVARQVQHLMIDQRSLNALDIAERFADGLATQEELAAACDAASDAAWAASAASAAASDAARAASAASAASAAAWAASAASDAASAAARDAWAASAAASAASAAAWDAQEKKLRELCAWCDQNPVAVITEQGEKE